MQLPKVSSPHGAPMGRTGKHGEPEPGSAITVERVELDSGGYDEGGAYWGIGEPLFGALSDCGNVESFFRAASTTKSSLSRPLADHSGQSHNLASVMSNPTLRGPAPMDKPKWTRGTWQSSYMGKVSGVDAQAYHHGPFVVYRRGSSWAVEHKPTRMGIGFPHGFRLLAKAKAYVADLAAIPAKWESGDVADHEPAAMAPDVRSAIEAAYAKHKATY